MLANIYTIYVECAINTIESAKELPHSKQFIVLWIDELKLFLFLSYGSIIRDSLQSH